LTHGRVGEPVPSSPRTGFAGTHAGLIATPISSAIFQEKTRKSMSFLTRNSFADRTAAGTTDSAPTHNNTLANRANPPTGEAKADAARRPGPAVIVVL
jgi:hypothetical protein